ncbi:MAG: threonine synthase, partial [Cyanobacteria bacterium P01_H01_bin.121]
GEGWTPLLKADRFGALLGLRQLYIKDERQGPTGSFKDRQASVAISVMREQGMQGLVLASTGNAGIAYAAYAAKAGIKLWIFFPAAVHDDKIREAALYGAQIFQVQGSYQDAKIAAADFAKQHDIFLDKGVKSFVAVESMKSMAFEITEQLGGQAPDWYIQAVSGGAGPIGVAQGFAELKMLGVCDQLPALGVIQSSGCAPMVNAFKAKQRTAEPCSVQTTIPTLTATNPGYSYQLLYQHIQLHGGAMESVSDQEAFTTTQLLAQTEGLSVEPGTAVAFAGLMKLAQQQLIQPDQIVVINCSGHTRPVDRRALSECYAEQVVPACV